jgi:predicted O-methyltransferase YrrM
MEGKMINDQTDTEEYQILYEMIPSTCPGKVFFNQLAGNEHYRLLSFLSKRFDHQTIIDIGTLNGLSALALSINQTNQIYSFDIVRHDTDPRILEKSNISFHLCDLWQKEIFEEWKSVFLSSSILFIDVDPHNGEMEWEFYNMLKELNYQGLIIWDDIFFFEPMRHHFWDRVPENEKIDLTHLGHFSGTGIISFQPNFSLAQFKEKWLLPSP